MAELSSQVKVLGEMSKISTPSVPKEARYHSIFLGPKKLLFLPRTTSKDRVTQRHCFRITCDAGGIQVPLNPHNLSSDV